MNHPSTRIVRTVAVAAAGVVVGLTATIAVAAGGSHPDVSEFQPAQRAEIADWAAAHHLSGLSPASLAEVEPAWSPRMAAETTAIAEYARDHELTGLSPASLRPLDGVSATTAP